MEPLYQRYVSFVKDYVLKDDSYFQIFKQHPDYQYMLEHVSYEQGCKYLNLLLETPIPYSLIESFCKKNDSLGSPRTYQFDSLTASPTSLRYIWQAYLILQHFKSCSLPFYNLVEIGGGYGGLSLAIDFLNTHMFSLPIHSYTILDLFDITTLQSLYISKMDTQIPISTVDSSTYGESLHKENMCLISNYCFSEIGFEHQCQYISNLFPRICHGFFAWNMIPVYDFGFPYRIEDEIPKTGDMNCLVYF